MTPPSAFAEQSPNDDAQTQEAHSTLNRPSVFATLNATAETHAARGEHAQALIYYKQALEIRQRVLQPDDPHIADSLDKVADTYRAMNEHAQALPLIERSLAIREQATPRNAVAIALSLNKLAETHFSLRHYAQTLELQQRTLAIYDTLPKPREMSAILSINLAVTHLKLGQQAEAVAIRTRAFDLIDHEPRLIDARLTTFLDRLAATHGELSQHGEALPILQRALAIAEQRTPADDREIATRLLGIARTQSKLGGYQEALEQAQRAVDIQQRTLPPDDADSIAGMGQLASIHGMLGAHEQALHLQQRVLQAREASASPDSPGLAIALNNLAATHQELGDYDEAQALFERVLALRESAIPHDALATAGALNNLGSVRANLGHFAQALSLYQQASALAQSALPENHPDLVVFQNNLAGVYSLLGRHGLARDLVSRGLALRRHALPHNHPDVAASLFMLANLDERAGDYEAAFPLHEEVLAIRKASLPPEHPDIAAALYELATSHAVLGRRERALPLLQQSLSIYQQSLPADHPLIARAFAALGNHSLWLRDYDAAASLLHKALVIALSNPGAGDERWAIQYWLGRLYTQVNRPDLAIVFYKEAVGTIQGMRSSTTHLDRSLQAGFLANYQFAYAELADQLIAANRIEEAQQILQMLKEQELYETLQRAASSDPRTTRLELTGLERRRFTQYYELTGRQSELAIERMALERKVLSGQITPDEQQRLVSVHKNLDSLSAAMAVFLTELEKQSVPFADREGRTETPPVLAERHLQTVLRAAGAANSVASAVAVQYVLTDTRLSILLSMPNSPVLARQIEIDAVALRRQIMTALDRLRTPDSDASLLSSDLRSLHALLIAPIESDLRVAGANMLIVVPNGILRYVPFAALMNDDRYLVQDYAITLFNEAVKKDFAAARRLQWQPVAMGLTRQMKDENLPALTAVRDEVRTVARSSGMSGRSYLDEEFTRKVLHDVLTRDFNVLHLATHFRFVPGRPDASRLFLGDLTTLTLADIARDNLRFDHFALVALSACESGLGGGLDGDGRELESLGALVQNQGAHAVVATLWKVSDGSTAELMKSFYGYRSIRKLSKAQALRAAQLSLIAGRRVDGATRTHPYYWAPFVLMGDWR